MHKYAVWSTGILLLIAPSLVLITNPTPYGNLFSLFIVISAAGGAALSLSRKSPNKAKYFPVLLSLIALVLSQGYLEREVNFPPVVPQGEIALFVISVVAAEAGIIMLSTFESMNRFEYALIKSMHDGDEVSLNLGRFSGAVFIMVAGAFIHSAVAYEIIRHAPALNIELFPSILLFAVIYLLLQKVVFRKKTETEIQK